MENQTLCESSDSGAGQGTVDRKGKQTHTWNPDESQQGQTTALSRGEMVWCNLLATSGLVGFFRGWHHTQDSVSMNDADRLSVQQQQWLGQPWWDLLSLQICQVVIAFKGSQPWHSYSWLKRLASLHWTSHPACSAFSCSLLPSNGY